MQTFGHPAEKIAVDQRESKLIAIVGELCHKLPGLRPISLRSRLEKNLGIDSLGRAGLVLHLERAFGAADPIRPSGTDLTALVRRAVLLAGCGEPDLGELIKLAHSFGSTR